MSTDIDNEKLAREIAEFLFNAGELIDSESRYVKLTKDYKETYLESITAHILTCIEKFQRHSQGLALLDECSPSFVMHGLTAKETSKVGPITVGPKPEVRTVRAGDLLGSEAEAAAYAAEAHRARKSRQRKVEDECYGKDFITDEQFEEADYRPRKSIRHRFDDEDPRDFYPDESPAESPDEPPDDVAGDSMGDDQGTLPFQQAVRCPTDQEATRGPEVEPRPAQDVPS